MARVVFALLIVAAGAGIYCEWPSEATRFVPIEQPTNLSRVLPFDSFTLRYEVYGPPNMTAFWQVRNVSDDYSQAGQPEAVRVVATDNIRIRTESEEARPCWHAFSVKVERAQPLVQQEWQIVFSNGSQNRSLNQWISVYVEETPELTSKCLSEFPLRF